MTAFQGEADWLLSGSYVGGMVDMWFTGRHNKSSGLFVRPNLQYLECFAEGVAFFCLSCDSAASPPEYSCYSTCL